MDEWIKKIWCIYVQWNVVQPQNFLPFETTLIDLEGILLSEIKQRNTNTVRSHLPVESKKKKKNLIQK